MTPRRGASGIIIRSFVETVFDDRLFNIVFIHFDRGEQAGRDIFKSVIQRGISMRRFIIAELDGNFRGGSGKGGNRLIDGHGLRAGNNALDASKVGILAGNGDFPRQTLRA